MSNAKISLADKYRLESGTVFLSGTQALVRLPLMQRRRDLAAGLNTAGYVSGYRGSPLGGYDQQLWQAETLLRESRIVFAPGVNEDLAATAVWGTQQVGLIDGAQYDGVFAIWYGKGPGVDRSGDPIKHGNRMGSAPHGGVLLVFGDDHAGKSSTVAHQSEQALASFGVPVLYPATVQEYLDLGLHGFAMSRHAGVWVGFKCVNETVETTATVAVGDDRVQPRSPASQELPPGGIHARHAFDPLGDDVRLMRYKLPMAQAYVRENGLDRTVIAPSTRRLGIVAAGKSWLDVMQALGMLGLDDAGAAAAGIGVYKPALIWPLEPSGIREFADGFAELLVVEEKAAFLEPQVAQALFNLPAGSRPRLAGKCDPDGGPLLHSDVPLDPARLALVIAARLATCGALPAAVDAHRRRIDARLGGGPQAGPPIARVPYFCSGCPHNTSTRVPEGSLAFSGIGCHTMAVHMERNTLPPTQMGGEGMSWAGIAPFSSRKHVFQNLGDGTYFHSGLLAIRAAVAAGIDITYKILVNDAVAMTGGQPVEGALTVGEITRQLAAERVARIAVVSDDRRRHRRREGYAPGVTVHERSELTRLQHEFRELRGVTAIIYEQTCAAEKRRRRKRGLIEDPPHAGVHQRACLRGLRRLFRAVELRVDRAGGDRLRPQTPDRPVELQQGLFLCAGVLSVVRKSAQRQAARRRRGAARPAVASRVARACQSRDRGQPRRVDHRYRRHRSRHDWRGARHGGAPRGQGCLRVRHDGARAEGRRRVEPPADLRFGRADRDAPARARRGRCRARL